MNNMTALFYLAGWLRLLPTLFEVTFIICRPLWSFPSLHALRCLSSWPDIFCILVLCSHLSLPPPFNFSDVKSHILGVKDNHVLSFWKTYLDDVIFIKWIDDVVIVLWFLVLIIEGFFINQKDFSWCKSALPCVTLWLMASQGMNLNWFQFKLRLV